MLRGQFEVPIHVPGCDQRSKTLLPLTQVYLPKAPQAESMAS